jgi:hypothetical protein
MAKGNVAPRQQFVDRIRGRLSFTADASAGVSESFKTGMNLGQTDPFMWSLLGFTICPNSVSSTPLQAANVKFMAQLAMGVQTGALDGDDPRVITTIRNTHSITTQGSDETNWPKVAAILYPLPVFCTDMTVSITGVNDAVQNSREYVYEIWFTPRAASKTDVLEYLAAFGQA